MNTINELFTAASAARPDAAAVVEGPRRITYGELAERVQRRAAGLVGAGVGVGDRVAMLDHNSLAFLELTFAVARLGAVLVPLNTRLAAAELVACLEDAGVKVLVHGKALRDLAARAAGEAEGCSALLADGLEGTDAPAPVQAGADDLAFLYYTSGTTGAAKGVMLTHGNVCSHARMAIDELGLSADDRWGHIAPMFHLADAWATLAITAVQGLHVICPRFDAATVLSVIEDERVTVTNLVPTMLNLIVAQEDVEDRDLSSTRIVLSGGAPIAPALVRRIMELFGGEYVQTYGLTETSPFLTVSLLREHLRDLPEDEAFRFRARTGRPFGQVDVEVVDAHDQPVPADDATVGEIRARGTTVSPGYWHRPDATAEAFRDGWLYTGDLAVVDAEGYVNIVDRKKDMILTGGENVYSTQVENVLSEHPAVLEVAVYGKPDEVWGERVCAAIALRAGHVTDGNELIAFCRERLAAFKAPREVHFLASLPKTGSGKIAKRLLRD